MNSAVCLALLFLVVSGFPQPARRAYIPSPAVGTYEGDAVDPPPVNVPKRRIARAADALYEPPSFADERFLECCKTQGFDDACAKFMCQWQNGRKREVSLFTLFLVYSVEIIRLVFGRKLIFVANFIPFKIYYLNSPFIYE